MKSKCTLLVDGNWLLISRFSVMTKLFRENQSEPILESATNNLYDRMARSIHMILNRFKEIDNIIFITDGGSWRKQLPIPSQLQNITYKGNREEEVGISWNHVFKALNKLSKRCKEVGITTCTQSNIEGDDWAWYWSRRLNAEGTSCIIWTSDHDLMQLVQNKGGIFTAWYNDLAGLTLHESLEIKNPDPDDLDFFMQPVIYKNPIIEGLEKRSGKKVNYIDPNAIINSKVICGDSGDNIKSVVRVVKSGRNYGVGPKDWEGVAHTLHIHTIQELISHKQDIARELLKLNKFRGYGVTPEQVLEMIDYNIKLVWLNEEVIPETILSVMNTHEYNQMDIDYLRGSYTVLLDDHERHIQEIFEGI